MGPKLFYNAVMSEGGNGGEKIVPLKKNPLARGAGESLTQHKRQISLYIKDLRKEIEKNVEVVRECDEGVKRWTERVNEWESQRDESVIQIDFEKGLQSRREDLARWQRDKEYHEKYRKLLDRNLDEAVRYRRTLDANPMPPKTE